MYSGASRLLEANEDDTGVVGLGRTFGSRHCLTGLRLPTFMVIPQMGDRHAKGGCLEWDDRLQLCARN